MWRGLGGTSAASALNVSGTWNAVYHCEHGWCAGKDFPSSGEVYIQAKGSNLVYAPGGVYVGTLNGNQLASHSGSAGEYEFDVVRIYAADGKSWSGPASDSNGTSGTDTGTRISGPPGEKVIVSGTVRDVYEKGLAGATLKLSGTSEEHEEISRTEVTNGTGKYSFEVPAGTYRVTASGEPPEQNGGSYSVSKPPTPSTPQCTGTPEEATCQLSPLESAEEGTANFTYTYCTAAERDFNGKPVSGCPIVFIPGFLGSRISCPAQELWPHLPTGVSTALMKAEFGQLILEPDGVTNGGAPGSCAKEAGITEGQAGVVGLAAGADIYQSVLGYLNRIVSHGPPTIEQGAYAFPYDWRKSPLIAAAALDGYVGNVLSKTGAKHVTLMAHSMGGLVLQAYLVDPAHAKNVARAITLGTPYWARRSHIRRLWPPNRANQKLNSRVSICC